jgi:putative membrane protein
MLWMALLWVGVILLVVWAVRGADDRGPSARGDRALGILEERFARGEVDAEEFAVRRRELAG